MNVLLITQNAETGDASVWDVAEHDWLAIGQGLDQALAWAMFARADDEPEALFFIFFETLGDEEHWARLAENDYDHQLLSFLSQEV